MSHVLVLMLLTTLTTLALPAIVTTLAARQDVQGRTPNTSDHGSAAREAVLAEALAEAAAGDRQRLLDAARDAWVPS